MFLSDSSFWGFRRLKNGSNESLFSIFILLVISLFGNYGTPRVIEVFLEERYEREL